MNTTGCNHIVPSYVCQNDLEYERFLTYADRYDDPSAVWVVVCAILMFFMKAGFLYIEQAFAENEPVYRRRVVLAKYLDTFGGTLGFFFFGFAISTLEEPPFFLGENGDFVFWFFRFTFASNTATILGGLLVGDKVQLRTISVFTYSFCMSGFIHPLIARMFWGVGIESRIGFSPFKYCNGTARASLLSQHSYDYLNTVPTYPDIFFVDFAGSGVVHLLGGMAGFVLAWFHKLEKKKKSPYVCIKNRRNQQESEAKSNDIDLQDFSQSERPAQASPPHDDQGTILQRLKSPRKFFDWMYPPGGGGENVESAALGVIILWTTWFAFNAGSTESVTGAASHSAVGRIALVMSVAAATGGLTSSIICGLVQIYKRDNAYNTNEIANGVLACLVAVTGCCPFIDPLWAILIGPLTVIFYHLGCYIEFICDLQDGARIFPVHAVSGFWGLLCVGLFYKPCLIKEFYFATCFCEEFLEGSLRDLLDGNGRGYMFGYQLAGGLLIIAFAVLFCTTLFFLLWLIPVKTIYYATGLHWIFCFPSEGRGVVNFKGNMLFTHFGEIGDPPLRNNKAG